MRYHAYVESFRTFRQDFAYRQADPQIEHSVDALKAWFAELDRDLLSAVEAVSEDDIESRKIVRADFDLDYFAPLPKDQLDVYSLMAGNTSTPTRVVMRPLRISDKWTPSNRMHSRKTPSIHPDSWSCWTTARNGRQ